MNLAQKTCKSCEGGVQPLLGDKIGPYLDELGDAWQTINDERLVRTFSFGTFADAMEFVNQVARLAESEGHHPDIEIHYSRVLIELSTHAIGGLSENDFILAAKINAL
ncbi:TPA: 4a-hydroxytetrahydrobiopterin dehydratase [Candidatus Uhrbacteria bacterium]|nr:4a-hydroxytetrahydrobiopterin dehydratase [Candidatus Uhrbacteria bacterium]